MIIYDLNFYKLGWYVNRFIEVGWDSINIFWNLDFIISEVVLKVFVESYGLFLL